MWPLREKKLFKVVCFAEIDAEKRADKSLVQYQPPYSLFI